MADLDDDTDDQWPAGEPADDYEEPLELDPSTGRRVSRPRAEPEPKPETDLERAHREEREINDPAYRRRASATTRAVLDHLSHSGFRWPGAFGEDDTHDTGAVRRRV